MVQRMFRAAFVVMVPILLAGTACKKKAPPETADQGPVTPEVSLQVTSMAPSTVAPQTASPAKLYGSAFEQGATVEFLSALRDRTPAENVAVESGNAIGLTVPALDAGSYDVVVTNGTGESATLRGGLQVKVAGDCAKVTVNFDLDSSRIRPDARTVLDQQMSCFQSLTSDVRVEGHCDERGTVDYNALLGQRRAESVKSYLVAGRVSASRVRAVSYGEERPLDTRHNEAAWARNRRAEVIATE